MTSIASTIASRAVGRAAVRATLLLIAVAGLTVGCDAEVGEDGGVWVEGAWDTGTDDPDGAGSSERGGVDAGWHEGDDTTGRAGDPDTTRRTGEDTAAGELDAGAVQDAADAGVPQPDVGASEGSCVGRCGEYDSNAACNCDAECASYQDCCADYAAVCGGDTGTSADTGAGSDAGLSTDAGGYADAGAQADAGPSSICGDGACDGAETEQSCPQDCKKGCSGASCPCTKGACCHVATGKLVAKGTKCGTAVAKTQRKCQSNAVFIRTAYAGCSGTTATCTTAEADLHWSAWKQDKKCAAGEVCAASGATASSAARGPAAPASR